MPAEIGTILRSGKKSRGEKMAKKKTTKKARGTSIGVVSTLSMIAAVDEIVNLKNIPILAGLDRLANAARKQWEPIVESIPRGIPRALVIGAGGQVLRKYTNKANLNPGISIPGAITVRLF